MTKEVTVEIRGLQGNEEKDEIITKSSGVYHFRNHKHYIQYDETTEPDAPVSHNTIKIGSDQIDIIKKGREKTALIFHRSQETQTLYHTPYGDLQIGIMTTKMSVKEEEKEMAVWLEYILSSQGSRLSDNSLEIRVISKADSTYETESEQFN